MKHVSAFGEVIVHGPCLLFNVIVLILRVKESSETREKESSDVSK